MDGSCIFKIEFLLNSLFHFQIYQILVALQSCLSSCIFAFFCGIVVFT